ncbi:hypothetical protein BKA93DRAFT_752064 [Sparassis latifolia]
MPHRPDAEAPNSKEAWRGAINEECMPLTSKGPHPEFAMGGSGTVDDTCLTNVQTRRMKRITSCMHRTSVVPEAVANSEREKDSIANCSTPSDHFIAPDAAPLNSRHESEHRPDDELGVIVPAEGAQRVVQNSNAEEPVASGMHENCIDFQRLCTTPSAAYHSNRCERKPSMRRTLISVSYDTGTLAQWIVPTAPSLDGRSAAWDSASKRTHLVRAHGLGAES